MNKLCIFYNSVIIQVAMETKLRYKTKIACVLLNTWKLVFDFPNKMIYMDMYTLVIFFPIYGVFSILPIGDHFGCHGNKENATLQNFLFFH